jgi:hypothetical protein
MSISALRVKNLLFLFSLLNQLCGTKKEAISNVDMAIEFRVETHLKS